MTEPIPVKELQKRNDEDGAFPITPGTNEETALRFLAGDPELGWPPSTIAEQTDINESSITKTMQRLHEKNLVARIAGRYYIEPDQRAEINGLLGDLHNAIQSQTHPADNSGVTAKQDDIAEPHASEDEIDELVE